VRPQLAVRELDAAHSMRDARIARARARRKAGLEHLPRRGDQHRHHIGVALAHGADDAARHVADQVRPASILKSTARGIPYMWPCALHQIAKAPFAAARSKADGGIIALPSKTGGGRVTTAGGKTTVASPQQAARARAINVSLPAPLGPTTSTRRPGPINFGRVVNNRRALAIQLMPPADRRATRCEPPARRARRARG